MYSLSFICTCVVIDCRDPGRPQNGRRSLGRTTYQSTVTYSCDSGYLLVGEESQQCQANGKWSGVLAVCSPVDCQDPGTPANGDRMLVSTTFMSTVFYSCRLGYNLEGNQHRICQASGNWSGDLPICKGWWEVALGPLTGHCRCSVLNRWLLKWPQHGDQRLLSQGWLTGHWQFHKLWCLDLTVGTW